MRQLLQNAHDRLGLRTNPTRFFGAAFIAIAFSVVTIVFTSRVNSTFSVASEWILTNLGWFYISGVTIFLLFLIVIALGRFGRVRLSPNDEGPDHSTLSWFAMLFAAGIGTILLFWAVAEPTYHFAQPPREAMGVAPESIQAAREAMAFTLYHFGLHTWTIFALPALAFAYFIYRRNLPPRVSSLFQPLLGNRIHGPIGALIDILAIVGTMLGIATSIGLGTLQINSGLERLFGVPNTVGMQIVIISVVSVIASVSAALGIERGIKRLSNFNIITAVLLLVFVLFTGPTLLLLKGTVESVGTYAAMLPELMLWNDTFDNTGWQNYWTAFYWAWTITWSPFVGIFIASISRGRTIRQFVFGVLGLPTLFSVIWYGIFGMATFDRELNGPGGLVEEVVGQGDIPGALFIFLEGFPLATFTSAVAIALVGVFFITSMDSAALVMDMMAKGYEEEGPVVQRVFFGLGVGLITIALIVTTADDGLRALQEVITVIGLPFFALGYFLMYSLWRGLKEDAGELEPLPARRWRRTLPPEEYVRRRGDGVDGDWHEEVGYYDDPDCTEPTRYTSPNGADPLGEVPAGGVTAGIQGASLPDGDASTAKGRDASQPRAD
ncbi:choline/carnitine/betaine transport [Kineosphaera limosa]|uniref:Putative BCCT family transporter n=1 Tax=Kineosphaera limosa NBRC 100340 TaxID=1184609 RepID=K6X9R7_9MICO|nr:BCCT family transporter [Kineosphaera limosa]NYD99879.1 choline/carnitine/betaine transport [Kineosphaera limosa]GAB95584.1 putative BCCT family transporter [Kineosphaera limosa NBRC 100340]